MSPETLFYGALKRRDVYETKEGGEFYVYSYYRTAIADDCKCCCVYCDCHEDTIGGREAMEIDHFRPWNKSFKPNEERKFAGLKHEPTNLVHACAVCNGFKSDHWPTEDPNVSYDQEKGWVEPFNETRADFLYVEETGELRSLKAPGEYQIKQLRLNRPLLKSLRACRIVKKKLDLMIEDARPRLQSIINNEPGSAHARTAVESLEFLAMIEKLIPCSNLASLIE